MFEHVHFQRERGASTGLLEKMQPAQKEPVRNQRRCHKDDPYGPDSLSRNRRGSSGGSSTSGHKSMISRGYELSFATMPKIRLFMKGPGDSM